MTGRPILFSAPMVRALLNGTKTQTRRLVKGLDLHAPRITSFVETVGWWKPRAASTALEQQFITTWPEAQRCPYGVPGDTLWVKETHRFDCAYDHLKPTAIPSAAAVFYGADNGKVGDGFPGKTRVSLHMQRRFSRITLRSTDVRVERLNEISADDADAECFGGDYPENVLPELFPRRDDGWGHLSLPECYARLWEHINGPGSWALNPWVWAINFERVS